MDYREQVFQINSKSLLQIDFFFVFRRNTAREEKLHFGIECLRFSGTASTK